jgi:hypothetical protein
MKQIALHQFKEVISLRKLVPLLLWLPLAGFALFTTVKFMAEGLFILS